MTAVTQQVTVEDAEALAELTYGWEVESAPDASPSSGPAWLRAYEGIDPRRPPCRYLLTRPGHAQVAAVPMHIAYGPVTPDADPRSYFGASAETFAERVCCGSQQVSPAAEVLASLDLDDIFPALILGSMPGYKTEVLHSYWTPELAGDLIDAAISYAQAEGIATILAPWVADHGSGRALGRELSQRGAVSVFWAVEHYIPLRHESLQAHLAAARSRDRYRYRCDMATAERIGLTVRRIGTDELRDRMHRIGVLAAATRRKYGQEIDETEIPTVLTRHLDLGVPLLTVGGFQEDKLVACCVSVEKGDRVYVKHGGFDYHALGTRSGAHFAVVMYGTLAAAFDRKARLVEYGIGAHQTKTLRGCQSRMVTSYLLTDRPHVRDIFSAAAVLNAPLRLAEQAGISDV